MHISMPPNIFDFNRLINHKNLALVAKSAEFKCSVICHENVMKCEDVTLGRFDDSYCAHVAGKKTIIYMCTM